MTDFKLIENEFLKVFKKAFPGIEIAPFRYGSIDEIKYSHFQIPPDNRYLAGSDYYLDKQLDFYHFTNLNALQSIISTKTLRLYNLNHLDDPREFLYAGKLLPQNDKFIEDTKENFFILSLCENIEQIKNSEKFNIWRLYGENGLGCILKISFIQNLPNEWNNFYLSKIKYGLDKKSPIGQISSMLSEINKKDTQMGIDLGQILCFHKSSLYKFEKEVRLLYDKRLLRGLGYTTIYDSNQNAIFPIIRTEISSKYDPKIKYLELPIVTNDSQPIDSHIPIIKIGHVILGYKLKNQFESIRNELHYLFEQTVGYCPSITLSRLSDIFWGK